MKNLRDVTDVAVVEVAKTVGSFHLLFLSFYWKLDDKCSLSRLLYMTCAQ